MTGSGWYNVQTLGTRDGACDYNFLDASGNPAGDPYGSMAYLSVVVPNQLNNGNSLPTVTVLAQGLKVPIYDGGRDIYQRPVLQQPGMDPAGRSAASGWAASEIDITSFAARPRHIAMNRSTRRT
jgi:hypothetical protein